MIMIFVAMKIFLELKTNDITSDSNDEYCNYKILLKIIIKMIVLLPMVIIVTMKHF